MLCNGEIRGDDCAAASNGMTHTAPAVRHQTCFSMESRCVTAQCVPGRGPNASVNASVTPQRQIAMLAPTPTALPQASPLHADRTAAPPRCRGGPRVAQRQSHRMRAVASELAAADAERLVTTQAERLRPVFAAVDETTKQNLSRVLTAFRDARVGSHMFAGVSSPATTTLSPPPHCVFLPAC